jgi:hypothetical protein
MTTIGVTSFTAETPPADPMWIEPAVLIELFPSLTEEQATAIATEATWVLDQLTNGFYHGVECWREVFEVRGCLVNLTKTPIQSVESVATLHSCDAESKPVEYCMTTEHVLSICPGDCGGNSYRNASLFDWRSNQMACGCPKRVEVRYTIGDNLPPGAKAAVLNLATEYGKAFCGQKCSLPERVTSITRQGIAWTILDPQDFMDKGLTGLSRIDSWISIARRGVPGGRAIDPLNHGRRVISKQIACAEPEPTP